ncbi:MAG: hypothetical protein LQ342_000242 [Letrouitia transgressa]|nr:MAG: hypothetical protein LQ342_000242 [Letrouitia transgressa]
MAAAVRSEAILSIGGMTCSVCTNAVSKALREMPFVKTVKVTLLTNSAKVIFSEPDKLDQIVQRVHDLGYDCSSDLLENISHSSDKSAQGSILPQRSVMLRIEGMFCNDCPARIAKALTSKFSNSIRIQQTPSLKSPFVKVTYTPKPPTLTIRNIMASIDDADKHFSTSVFHPPTLEERSQEMHMLEKRRIIKRLLISATCAIPTFLFGVVWMTLVPETDKVRKYLDASLGTGTVTRTQWALFILATPVMFLAADIFHVRALKEIGALWRRKSKAPLLRRFYSFGSMNLLISAATTVAYVSSVALLIIGATSKGRSKNMNNTYFDSVVFLTFFILSGKFLEAYSKAKTGDAIAMLGNLRPQEAILVEELSSAHSGSGDLDTSGKNLVPATMTRKVKANQLEVGDVVAVPHGTSPPADGIIVRGSTKFNESSLTGEARDITKTEGEQVFTGTVNTGRSPVQVEIKGIAGSSMLDQIIAVVREGQANRAPVERYVDSVIGLFVPVITALAILTFLVWFSLGQSGALSQKYLDDQQGGWAFWSLEFAISVFVVACPCGIGLAAPTALFVGGGLAAKNGILARGGGEAFQEASNIDAVVFDKTGTLTEGGNPQVTDHILLTSPSDDGIAWSAVRSLEDNSSHPLARALSALASKELASREPVMPVTTTSISEEPGRGLRGTFKMPEDEAHTARTYDAAIGSEAFIIPLLPTDSPFDYWTLQSLSTWKSHSKSVALLALRQHPVDLSSTAPQWTVAAVFAISDSIRSSAIPTISALQSRDIPVYMLTGDNRTTALAVAASLSIPADHVFAGVLPAEKADKIRSLQNNGPRRSQASLLSRCWVLSKLLPKSLTTKQASTSEVRRRAIVAFVGDGINDAPALSTASVSISLASGSDIAVHSSSFVLLSSEGTETSLENIVRLFDLSRAVFRRVKLNFAWAIVYNLCLVPVAAGVFFWVRDEGWTLGPVWSSAAMALSSISVVMSSLALRWGW